jgi:hypothetical protein
MSVNGLPAADHVALTGLVHEILWRIDHGKADTIYELWTEDGELFYDGAVVRAGRDELKEWGRTRLPPESIQHLAMNLRFAADGPESATGTGAEIVFFDDQERRGPQATLPLNLGDWSFRFARTDGGWRFASVNYDRLFDRREDPGDLF